MHHALARQRSASIGIGPTLPPACAKRPGTNQFNVTPAIDKHAARAILADEVSEPSAQNGLVFANPICAQGEFGRANWAIHAKPDRGIRVTVLRVAQKCRAAAFKHLCRASFDTSCQAEATQLMAHCERLIRHAFKPALHARICRG